MKIAVIGTRGFPGVQGGIETHCQKLYPRIVADGFDVTVFGRQCYLKKKHPFEYQGVHVVPLPCSHHACWEAITHALACIPYIFVLRPDIIHIHGIGPALFAPLFRLMGAKVVYTHHGQDYLRDKWGKIAKVSLKLGERIGTRFASRVVVISEYIDAQLKKRYHCKRTILIRNGVELPDRSTDKDSQWLTKHKLESHRYIFALGRFVQEKGFHDLIAAYQLAHPDGVKLCIAGEADHENAYSLRLKKQAYEAGVILAGFITGDELGALFSNACLFVIPSSHEGLPIVLLEALSYGLDIVASDIPANLEEPLPRDCFYPVGNTKALSQKITDRLAHGTKMDCKEVIQEFYNWDKIAVQTANVYREITKGKAA